MSSFRPDPTAEWRAATEVGAGLVIMYANEICKVYSGPKATSHELGLLRIQQGSSLDPEPSALIEMYRLILQFHNVNIVTAIKWAAIVSSYIFS